MYLNGFLALLLSKWKVTLYINDAFGDFQVGWFKEVTYSDPIRQVSLAKTCSNNLRLVWILG